MLYMDYVDSCGKVTKAKMISFDYLSPEDGMVEKVRLTDWICRRFIQKQEIIELENLVSDIIVLDPKFVISDINVIA